jgi:PAP2 superfamily protein
LANSVLANFRDAKYLKKLGAVLRQEIAEHRFLIGLVALYCLFGSTLGFVFDRKVDFFLYSSEFLAISLAVVFWFVYRNGARLVGKTEKGKYFNTLCKEVTDRVNLNQAVGGGLLFVVFSIYFSVFQSTKVMIPAVNPYKFDALFAELDRTLHGGYYPHELLQPLLGYAPVTFVIQFFYNLWFPIMLGVLAWQMFDRSTPALRMRFLVSFALAWFVIGTLGAMALSSAGPVYFDRITGLSGPYDGLMSYLHQAGENVPLFFLDMQELLWTSYTDNEVAAGAGISAMPSLHVSIAVLLFLFARHKAVWLRWLFGLFAVVIMAGSVHLAWHYAVDGYLGGALMAGIWWIVGRFISEPEGQVGDEEVQTSRMAK